jgi:protoporphyrinogen/coproporphyrinogen III oxidase
VARRPVIIGGGIAGLAAAYEFCKAGRRPLVIEERPRLGGVIQTDTVEGCVLEAGPDSFLSAKPAGLELITELGLGDEVIGSNDRERVTYLVRNNRLVPMPDGLMMMVPTRILPVATSSLLSWGTKIRMGLEYFKAPPAAAPPDRTVAEFIREHYGQETVDYLAEPLLSGVYGGTADALSVKSVLPRFVEIERKYGSLTKGVLAARRQHGGAGGGPLFRTLKGGLQQLIDKLVPYADALHHRAEAVERTNNGFRIRAGADWIDTDALVLAVPAYAAGALLRPIHPPLAEWLEEVPYSSSITLALVFDQKDCGRLPPGHGFLVPRLERRSLVACTFVQAKFNHRVPPGKIVLRCFLGGAGNESVLDRSDDEIVASVQAELKDLLGWSAKPAAVRLTRWRKAMAQYTVGHTARVDSLRGALRELPGLELAGNAYDGIGIPDCIRLGRASARSLCRQPG